MNSLCRQCAVEKHFKDHKSLDPNKLERYTDYLEISPKQLTIFFFLIKVHFFFFCSKKKEKVKLKFSTLQTTRTIRQMNSGCRYIGMDG